MITLAAAWAGAPVLITAPSRCRRWDDGARCMDGQYEVTVRTTRLRPGTTERSAAVGRFLDLLDWPDCRFGPALLDGHEGIQARCRNGEQGWIGRWWVVGGTVYSQGIAGPDEGLADAATQWFQVVRFRDRPISAPPL